MFGGSGDDGYARYQSSSKRGAAADDDDDPLADADEAVLLRHLGFANDTEVSDDELRAALQQKLTEAGDNDQLVHFYLRVHDRFFPTGEEEEETEQDEMEEEADDDEAAEEAAALEEEDESSGGSEQEEEDYYEDEPPRPAKRVRIMAEPAAAPPLPPPPARDEPLTAQEAEDIPRTTTRLIPTSVFDYQRGTVTPLQRRVVQRTIQLDSQSRDPRQELATSYVFDLSDKLEHVVKVSVFAVTVPYHWYTVGTAFGSDFFFLAPTAPGVVGLQDDDNRYTVKVKVKPGNYTAPGLAEAVRTAIAALPAAYPRLAFYNTDLIFNAAPGTATLRVAMQNTFEDPFWVARLSSRLPDDDEVERFMPPTRAFTTTTTTNDDESAESTLARRGKSLSAYLGFNRPQYATSCAYSLPLSSAIEATGATTKLTITTANQKLTIVHYLPADPSLDAATAASLAGTGTPDYTQGASTLVGGGTTAIELFVPLGVYTQQTLMRTVNAVMAADGRLEMAQLPDETTLGETFVATAENQLPLSGSYLAFEQITDQTTLLQTTTTVTTANHQQYNQMRFVWSVRLRRDSTRTGTATALRGKLALLLPNTTVDDINVWVGDSRGMNFASAQLELQTLRAETPLLSSNYIVGDGTTMTFEINSSTLTDEAKAAGVAPVNSSNSTGYSLAQYLAAINAGLTLMDPNADYFTIKTAFIDPANGFFRLDIDFARVYAGAAHYQYSCSGTDYFFANFGISSTTNPLLGDGVAPISLTGTFQNVGSYDMTQNKSLFRLDVATGGRDVANIIQQDGGTTTEVVVPFVGATKAYVLTDLLDALKASLDQFADDDGARLLSTCDLSFAISADGSSVRVTFLLAVVKRVTESALVLTLANGANSSSNWANTSWYKYLNLQSQTYELGSDPDTASVPATGARRLSGNGAIQSDVLELARDTPWTFPAGDDDVGGGGGGGVVDPDSPLVGVVAPPQIVVPQDTYTRQSLFTTMNRLLSEHPDLAGSAVRTATVLGVPYCELRMSVCRSFGPESHELLMYSSDRFLTCVNKTKATYATANVAPTQTLGWILGFHTLTRYGPLDADASVAAASGSTFFRDTTNPYVYSTTADGRGVASITGGATVTVNPYATLYLTLDDFSQNRANDTVVSIAARDSQYSQISGSSRRNFQCDPATGRPYVSGTSAARMQTLTRNALYANMSLLYGAAADAEAQRLSTSTNAASVPTDTLAVLPLGTGVSFGQSFTWQLPAGDGAAAMTRMYTGPIKLARGKVQLLTDRGAPLNLNGQNWSVTLLCELLASPALP